MLCFVSCKGKVKPNDALYQSRDSIPGLHVWEVSTVISDSGITRFRLNTPEWIVYDKPAEPYWLFPKGLHFESFNENLDVFASVDADSAVFYNQKEFWVLVGNVKSMNLDGERFETDVLYVDQQADRIYTDHKINITQSDKIINGVGFESNQRLSKYTILNPTGIIPVDEEEQPQDSTAVAETDAPEQE